MDYVILIIIFNYNFLSCNQVYHVKLLIPTSIVPFENKSYNNYNSGLKILSNLSFLVTAYMLMVLHVIFLFHRVIIEEYCIKIISNRKNTCQNTHFTLRQMPITYVRCLLMCTSQRLNLKSYHEVMSNMDVG